MIHKAHSGKIYDTAIIGGGVLGLWAARHAIKRGEKVVLLEKRKIGAGASGGFLGALMPHMPDNWNSKKQFQFEGLDTLEATIAELEEETGVDCGYLRCGRIMPITNEKLLGQIDRRIKGADENWLGRYNMTLRQAQGEGNTGKPHLMHPHTLPNPERVEGWINPEIATHGIQSDTISARINPRQYLSALDAYVRPKCDLIEGADVVAITLRQAQGEGGTDIAQGEGDLSVAQDAGGTDVAHGEGIIELANGDAITASKIIVANGYEAYPLLQPFMGGMNADKPIGRGVKGQAVLVEYAHNDQLPIVYHDGSYVVPHDNNRVAIGSTSENEWQGANVFDENNMSFYQRAIDLVPALKDAPILEKWAGVRPRNTLEGRGTEPYFNTVQGYDNLLALLGGFKITLGIAHILDKYS